MEKLPFAPLQEVILEVKWDLTFDSQIGAFTDPDFQLALGKFHSGISNRFPVVKQKVPMDVPVSLLNHQTIYQFWKGENVWPVLQIGPGVVSINDTEKNYHWEQTFYPLVKEVSETLCKAYNSELNFSGYSLRYIDVIRIKDYNFSDWKTFIEENLNFSFKNQFNTHGDLSKFMVDQEFDIESGGKLKINISTGKNNKKEDVLIMQIAFIEELTMDKESLFEKIDKGHTYTSVVFKDICKKELYDTFINR